MAGRRLARPDGLVLPGALRAVQRGVRGRHELAGVLDPLAERVREGIEALEFPLEDESGERRVIQITASLGAASLGEGIEDMRELVAAADAALYRAKRAGKNQTVRAS